MENGSKEFIEKLKKNKFRKLVLGSDYFSMPNGASLTDHLQRNDLTRPVLLQSVEGSGMSVPIGLTLSSLPQHFKSQISVFDSSRPHYRRMTVTAFAKYVQSDKWPPLHSAASLPLAGTTLDAQFAPPSALKALDLMKAAFVGPLKQFEPKTK